MKKKNKKKKKNKVSSESKLNFITAIISLIANLIALYITIK